MGFFDKIKQQKKKIEENKIEQNRIQNENKLYRLFFGENNGKEFETTKYKQLFNLIFSDENLDSVNNEDDYLDKVFEEEEIEELKEEQKKKEENKNKDYIKMTIIDYIEKSDIYSSTDDFLTSNFSVTEALNAYCKNNKIKHIDLELLNKDYLSFEASKKEFKAIIKDKNKKDKFVCVAEMDANGKRISKKDFDNELRDIVNQITYGVINKNSVEKYKQIKWNNKYLDLPPEEKSQAIAKTMHSLRKSKWFNEKQLSQLLQLMKNGADINCIANPMFSDKQMEFINRRLDEVKRYGTSIKEFSDYFNEFNQICLENFKYPFTDGEFSLLYSKYMSGDLKNIIKTEEFKAILKIEYLFEKSLTIRQPIRKEYNNLMFEFSQENYMYEKDGRDQIGIRTYIDLIKPNEEPTRLFYRDHLENNQYNYQLFIDSFIKNKQNKEINNNLTRYVNICSNEESKEIVIDLMDQYKIKIQNKKENECLIQLLNETNQTTNYYEIKTNNIYLDDIIQEIQKHQGIKQVINMNESHEIQTEQIPNDLIELYQKQLKEKNISYTENVEIDEEGNEIIYLTFHPYYNTIFTQIKESIEIEKDLLNLIDNNKYLDIMCQFVEESKQKDTYVTFSLSNNTKFKFQTIQDNTSILLVTDGEEKLITYIDKTKEINSNEMSQIIKDFVNPKSIDDIINDYENISEENEESENYNMDDILMDFL